MYRAVMHALSGLFVLVLLLGWVRAGGADETPPPRPVDAVDLERYAGLWYEIAKIPNKFEKQCAYGTTATYTLRPDGKIEVVNRCFKKDDSVDEIKGLAKVADPPTGARLKVSFFSILGLRPVWAPYWVLGLGADYEYAVVGTPDRKYGWILARTPQLSPETLEEVWSTVREQGYDPDDFEIVPH
jgi:apolipoprotein D and lipocalin family protein